MSFIMRSESKEFCDALTKLTKEFGIAIVGDVRIEALEEHEISDFDFYSPADNDHQKIEWSLHPVVAG